MFDAVVACLPIKRKYFTQVDAGVALDLAIQFQERKAKLARKRAAQCRLAGAAQPDQSHTPLSMGSFLAEFAHETEYHVLELPFVQLFEKAANQPLLDRSFVLV